MLYKFDVSLSSGVRFGFLLLFADVRDRFAYVFLFLHKTDGRCVGCLFLFIEEVALQVSELYLQIDEYWATWKMFSTLLLQELLCVFCVRGCIKWGYPRSNVQILFVQVTYGIIFWDMKMTRWLLSLPMHIYIPHSASCARGSWTPSLMQAWRHNFEQFHIVFFSRCLSVISLRTLNFK